MRTNGLHCLHDVLSLRDSAKNDVSTVEPACKYGGDEELTAVSVRACVGHRKTERLVLEFEVFVFEAISVDGSSSGAISPREVTTLDHEVRDNSMEVASLIAKFSLSFAKLDEVVDSPRDNCSEHINYNISSRVASNVDREGHFMSDSLLNKLGDTSSRPQRAPTITRANRRAFIIKLYTRQDILPFQIFK